MNANKKWDNYLVYFLFAGIFICFLIVIFNTQNSFGGGDHYTHFKLAYWGWKYPDMLFDHWGKPVFTILISPFAQFGIDGARLYNVLMGLLTAFFSWKLAKHFGFHHSWAVIILVLFMPVYFILMFTSLTEVTFSFFLVLAIYLFFRDKHLLSAITLSFLPLIRTEGIILIPLFILAWSLKRKFKVLPYLLTGTILISLAGWSYHESFLWLFTEMPYTGSAKDIYGSGDLLHFVNLRHKILGSFISYLFLLGVAISVYNWFWSDKFLLGNRFYFLLLIVGSFLVFVAAHSYVWWKGIGNSLGLIRVIGSVTPLAALSIMPVVSLFFVPNKKWISALLAVLLFIPAYFFIKDGIYWHRYGFKPSKPQMVLNEASAYIEENNLKRHKIYYFNNYLAFLLDLDPRDNKKSQYFLPQNASFLSSLPDSSIIVWDAHFGPNEGRVPYEKLENSRLLRKLKTLRPEKPFTVLGGNDYRVVIFQKDLSLNEKIKYFHLDFEESGNINVAYKGDSSYRFDQNESYKNLLDIVYQEYSDTISSTQLVVKIAFMVEAKEPGGALLVCTMETGDEMLKWESQDMVPEQHGEWSYQTYSYLLPAPASINDRIKVYVWNKENKEVYIDEVHLLLSPVE